MTKLRLVREDDLDMIMKWRMLPEITKYMYTDPILTLEIQKKWYRSVKESDQTIVFVIEDDGMPIGILSINDIDKQNKRCTWAYYIAVKEKRSLKLALALEWNLYDYVFDVLGMNKLSGEIFSFNKEVIRIHQMCGSTAEGELRQYIYKNGQYYDITIMSILREEWKQTEKKRKYETIEFNTQC